MWQLWYGNVGMNWIAFTTLYFVGLQEIHFLKIWSDHNFFNITNQKYLTPPLSSWGYRLSNGTVRISWLGILTKLWPRQIFKKWFFATPVICTFISTNCFCEFKILFCRFPRIIALNPKTSWLQVGLNSASDSLSVTKPSRRSMSVFESSKSNILKLLAIRSFDEALKWEHSIK